MRRLREQKGFTLIEVLISMAIFVSFMTVLIGSYTGIVRGQRDANDYRLLYSEARTVFDKLTDEVRDSAVYYPETTQSDLILLSKDGDKAIRFQYEPDQASVCFVEDIGKSYFLNSDTKITKFDVFVSPAEDPYLSENVYKDVLQFQPKVTVVVRFSKEMTNGKIYEMDLQTTISSRIYGSIIAGEDFVVPIADCDSGFSLNPLEF